MAKITYTLFDFDFDKANKGHLCAMVRNNTSDTTITSEDVRFFGTGFTRKYNSDVVSFASGGQVYLFDKDGNGCNYDSSNRILKLAVIESNYHNNYFGGAGNLFFSSTRATTNIHTSGDPETVIDENNSSHTFVDSLNARDQFAVEAMQGMLSKISDPSALGDSEISHYCAAAYQWAKCMMVEAAAARATVNDDTASKDTSAVSIGALETNSEKLLNNLIAAIERTDQQTSGSTGHWKKGDTTSNLPYTDQGASFLPHDPEQEAYTSIADAKADGWEYIYNSSYSKTVTIPEAEEALTNIEQLFRAYVTHTPEGEGDTKTTVGLDDLIQTIEDTNPNTKLDEVKVAIVDFKTQFYSSMTLLNTTMSNINSTLGQIKTAIETLNTTSGN